jgi:glyoxylase-like metal-dependent hydrolase (beta-lactamase superfamily II)
LEPRRQLAHSGRRIVEGPLDLRFHGAERVIGVYLLETEDGPALFDCGPSTCVGALERELAGRGLALTDVRHLLVSHIHLDHAGAAGVLVRRHPALRVHVSAVGAPHLVDPSRLERSARRLYGEAFDELWGELAPVPAENVAATGDRVLGLDCFPSPGHASHHVCYLDGEGTLLAGDATGVRIAPARLVGAPCPPPEFDLEAWERTVDEIARRAPRRLALIHFGVFDDVERHLGDLRQRLRRWERLVAAGASEAEFLGEASAELAEAGEQTAELYERAMPLWQSYAGLKRYVERRRGS